MKFDAQFLFLWDNTEISQEILSQIACSSLAIDNSIEKSPKQLSIIPLPTFNMKILTKTIHYEDDRLRGGKGFAAMSIVFHEEKDLIFYKYNRQFEAEFEVFSQDIMELVEQRSIKFDLLTKLQQFHDDLDNLILNLKSKELQPRVSVNWEPLLTYKILICGDVNVGKTLLVLRYTDNAFHQEYLATIGVNIASKKLMVDYKRKEFLITLWDIAGQNKFSFFRRSYFGGASGFILVYDISDKNSFNAIKDWHRDIRKFHPKIPGILVGNKKDLEDNRAVSFEELSDMERIPVTRFRNIGFNWRKCEQFIHGLG